jgi:hypothetical protein
VVFDEMIALVADWFDETLKGRKTGRDLEKPIELAETPGERPLHGPTRFVPRRGTH